MKRVGRRSDRQWPCDVSKDVLPTPGLPELNEHFPMRRKFLGHFHRIKVLEQFSREIQSKPKIVQTEQWTLSGRRGNDLVASVYRYVKFMGNILITSWNTHPGWKEINLFLVFKYRNSTYVVMVLFWVKQQSFPRGFCFGPNVI